MKERLKQIRRKANLSQEKFGERLGITKTSISKMELGIYNITDTMIKLICSEFNINEDWLRYGIGEMTAIDAESVISELEQKFRMGEIFKKAVLVYLKANELEQAAIDFYLEKIFKEVNGIDQEE